MEPRLVFLEPFCSFVVGSAPFPRSAFGPSTTGQSAIQVLVWLTCKEGKVIAISTPSPTEDASLLRPVIDPALLLARQMELFACDLPAEVCKGFSFWFTVVEFTLCPQRAAAVTQPIRAADLYIGFVSLVASCPERTHTRSKACAEELRR